MLRYLVHTASTVFAKVNKGLQYMAYLVAELWHSSFVSGRTLILILAPSYLPWLRLVVAVLRASTSNHVFTNPVPLRCTT